MNRRLIQQRADASLAAAGRELARLSEPEDFVLVMSSDVARDPSTGVPNNFEQPDLFFHANRKGRSIARDDLTGAKLTAALDFRPKWFVAFTALRQQQDPGFSQAIQERMRLAASGTGFEIYEVVSPSPRVRETRGELPARAATP
jgi:hypothetical protein